MTYEDQKKELYFANVVIGVIDNVKTPMLMYQEEKDVVRKALRMYIDRIESDMRGRQNRIFICVLKGEYNYGNVYRIKYWSEFE